ncbi:hypothetical protein SUGI_1157730 [Cryptomeria japonica]|uniref:uncharacterized protein LOC131071629 n=1 Tax=Cryptomeria japonica TaxID=3369 RepID=UPI00241479A7|nr:uncharacterized protein LOC131071629 [Cryptomeria japonica]GLJ54078.1 hypothetical protein SUGI_1157730 [Cryptomeria japonica]
MDIEFQEPMFQCPSHPSQEVVGICASCLRDRLYCLKRKNKLRRPSFQNISYSSDSDSCLEFDEIRLENFDHPVEKKEIVGRKKFLWLTKNKNPRTSTQKDKRTFFSLRSIFHRLRRHKQEAKPDICISHEDSFISIKLDGDNERSQWECRTVGSSARSSSVCEGIGKGPFYEPGVIFKRSSYTIENDNDMQKEEEEEEEAAAAAASSTTPAVRWRTRMNALVRMKCRVQDKVFNDSNYCHNHNQYPNPKMWSLSSLYNNYHESRHCIRSSNGTKKSWLRNLTSPKWSLH